MRAGSVATAASHEGTTATPHRMGLTGFKKGARISTMATQDERKRLSKLKRSELLEIILAQSNEIERLRAELAEKDKELESKRIAISESGSIAEASLKLTHIFEDAQKAADLYLANVKRNQYGGNRFSNDQAPQNWA